MGQAIGPAKMSVVMGGKMIMSNILDDHQTEVLID